jgi:hypothetical protein
MKRSFITDVLQTILLKLSNQDRLDGLGVYLAWDR